MKNNALSKLVSIASLCLFFTSAMSHGPVNSSSKKKYYTEFKYEYINDKIIIPIEIENNTYKFVFDTGVPSVISEELFKKITIKNNETLNLQASNSTSISLNLVTIPEIKIAGVPFKNTTSLVENKILGTLLDCLNVDGSIGSSMLNKSIIQILPRRNLIRLTNNRKKIPLEKQDASKLTLSGNQSQPLFWLEIQGKTEVKDQVLFDTGLSGLYNISQKRLDELEQKEIINKSGNNEPMPLIKLAQAIFKNSPLITSATETSTMGTSLLNYGNVTINFKNKKFYFDPFDKEINLAEQTTITNSNSLKKATVCP